MKYIPSRESCLPDSAKTAFQLELWKTDRALKIYDSFIDAIVKDPRLTSRSARFLERCWNSPLPIDALTMARRDVREALSYSAIQALLHSAYHDASTAIGSDRLRMLTTCPSSGYSDYKRPKLQLARLRAHFCRAMKRRRFEGAGILDFALIAGARDTEATEIGIHFHAPCRPVADREGEAFRGSSTRKNTHGLNVVHVSMHDDPLTWNDIAGLPGYASKVSCGLKEEGSVTTETSQLRWQPHHALRALEVLSHLSPAVSIVAVGDFGNTLKQRWEQSLRTLTETHRDGCAEIDHRRISRRWQQIYRELGLDSLSPVSIS